MAKLVVKGLDATHANPVKNDAGCYKAGDVVAVMPDSYVPGNGEQPPAFVVVDVPGVPVQRLEHLLAEEESSVLTDRDGKPTRTRRRAIQLNLATIPQRAVTEAEVLPHCRSKRTGTRLA